MPGDTGGFPRRPGILAGQGMTITGTWPNQRLVVAGVQFWTESQSFAIPNGTIPVSVWTPFVVDPISFPSVDAVIAPKGVNGSLLAQIPTNTTVGGNKRGAKSVDFQMTRAAATSVCSGSSSFLGGGEDNTVSSSLYGGCVAGNANTVSGSAGFNGAGINNLVSGTNSWCLAGSQASTRGITGKGAFANGTPSAPGDAQGGMMPLRRFTSDATPSALTGSGTAASSTNIDVMPNTSTYLFQVMVVGHKNQTNTAGWIIEGLINRDANAASTLIIGTNVTRSWGSNGGAPPAGWNVTVTADTTNGGLLVTVTGAAATQIFWSGVVRTTEAKG